MLRTSAPLTGALGVAGIPVVHLLGISHSFQLRAVLPLRDNGLIDNIGAAPIADELENYIRGLIRPLAISTIAEEYSAKKLKEKLEIDPKAYLIGMSICGSFGQMEHLFCDPDHEEREVLFKIAGISKAEDTRRGFPVREAEWLRRLHPYLSKGNVLFLCGACHIDSFGQKLVDAGIEVKLLVRDFEDELFYAGKN